MKKLCCVAILLVGITFTSCQKDENPAPQPTPEPTQTEAALLPLGTLALNSTGSQVSIQGWEQTFTVYVWNGSVHTGYFWEPLKPHFVNLRITVANPRVLKAEVVSPPESFPVQVKLTALEIPYTTTIRMEDFDSGLQGTVQVYQPGYVR